MEIFKRNSTKLFFSTFVFLTANSYAATLSLSGDYRFGTNLYSNLDVGPGVRTQTIDGVTSPTSGNTSTFWENRLLVRPDILIDDRFTLKSELNLLQIQSSDSVNVPPEFGSVLDRGVFYEDASVRTSIRKAYFEWASDWGLMRIGRQPKSWGLGVLYNSGADPLSDFSTHVDRVGFQALLGNLGLNLGFEKESEKSLNWDNDDGEIYELALDYSNPEALFDVGLLYSRAKRAPLAGSSLASSHDFSIFTSRRWGNFQAGVEAVALDQDGTSTQMGFLGQVDLLPKDWNFGVDFAYASASSEGSFGFHPNYQPFMILFRQSLGTSRSPIEVRGGSDGASRVGGAVGEGNGNGAIVAKARFVYNFDQEKYKLGTDFGYAKLIRQGSNLGTGLGIETDIHLAQKWYKNFTVHYGLGMLFPGTGLGENAQTVWGFQLRGVLVF